MQHFLFPALMAARSVPKEPGGDKGDDFYRINASGIKFAHFTLIKGKKEMTYAKEGRPAVHILT
jgi:hypothetical protein